MGKDVDTVFPLRDGRTREPIPGPVNDRKIGKSIRLRFRRAGPARRERAQGHLPGAHNGPYVHAGCRLPKGKPRSGRIVRGISGELKKNDQAVLDERKAD
jgi:hypothetical protein